MKTQEQLFAEWGEQLPSLTQKCKVSVLSKYPNLLSGTIAVSWSATGDNFKVDINPIMEASAYFIMNPEGHILISYRRMSQEYLPDKLKSAIKELYPEWTGTGAFTFPVRDIKQFVDTHGAPWGNWFEPGVDVKYEITFETKTITAKTLKQTSFYKIIQIDVNQYGVIL